MSEAEIADLKDRMAAGSRWLKAEIKGREKAEADARAANAVVVSLEADLAEAEGIIKDYELWCLDMGRIPIQRAAERESGSRASAPEPDPECGADRGTAAKPAARDPDDERECAG